ncbi:MAG: 2-oxo acid dehydrogenase subunit E2 [Trueperaceae bacterium]|nr:2-oxo acid dehydrogenase subunit E2 [Trueperaceae bacterium]
MATEFKLPEVGEGIDSGTVVAVLVSVGDRIAVDEPVIELETDKAVVEVPSDVAGVVESVAVAEGDEIDIGAVVLTVAEGEADGEGTGDAEKASAPQAEDGPDDGAEEAEKPAEESAEKPPEKPAEERAPAAAKAEPSEAKAKEPASAGGGAPAESRADAEPQGETAPGLIPAAPSVRRLARELGVDLQAVQGSGILGRISAEDVQAFAKGETKRPAAAQAPRTAAAPAAQPLPDFSQWGETERVAMSGIRKATVRTMTNAWTTVPMVTHFDKADATEFEALRQRFKPQAEKIGAKLTPTAMLIKVVAAALHKFPDFNASIDAETQEIVYKKYVNVGVAVDTDHGLLVPVVKNADRKNMLELAAELGELAEKARNRKLSPDEMQGGNFSVSNLGGIGGTGFTPIVAPPDVAILGVSRGGMEPVWDAENEVFTPRMTMPLSVTYDHRLIDGASAARFLRWVCRAIEEPFLMSLEG